MQFQHFSFDIGNVKIETSYNRIRIDLCKTSYIHVIYNIHSIFTVLCNCTNCHFAHIPNDQVYMAFIYTSHQSMYLRHNCSQFTVTKKSVSIRQHLTTCNAERFVCVCVLEHKSCLSTKSESKFKHIWKMLPEFTV